MWQNLKPPNLTKLKNSKYEKTQKLQIWQYSECDKIQNVTKLETWNLKNQKPKKWQNTETQTVTKLKTWNVTKLKNSNGGIAQNSK